MMNTDEIPRTDHPRTILVATDFSAPAARATDLAAALALRTGARICLLHVFEPPSVLVPELLLEPRVEQALREAADQHLAAAKAKLISQGLVVEEQLRIDSPPEQVIADVAREVDPQLVVMGNRGRRPLPRLLLGSVAEGTLLRTKHPVMVVPEGSTNGMADLSAERRWRIAVGIDLSNSSRAAVDWVGALRRQTACDVVFIHLYWPPGEYQRLGLTGPRDPFAPDALTMEILENSLRAAIGTLPGQGAMELKIMPCWGSTAANLVEQSVEARADFLVMGTHHRHGYSRLLHGATVPPVLHAGKLPVVCVSTPPLSRAEQPIPRLRTILAASDLSDHGGQAVAHAYALARAEKGLVHLLHVHERPLADLPYVAAPDPKAALSAEETRELQARLRAQVPAEAAALGIPTSITVIDGGSAGEVICQTAERVGADAICVGSHARGRAGRALLGSVAAQVVNQAGRPVFVVPHGAE